MSVTVSTTSGNTITVTESDGNIINLTTTTSSVSITSPTTSSITVTNKGPKGDTGATGTTGATGATGTSGTTTAITVADESSDTTCFPVFVTAATGELAPKTGTNLAFNSSTGDLTVGGAIIGKTYQTYHHNIWDDINTSKVYLPTNSQSTGEQNTANSVYIPLLAPATGKLLTVVIRVPSSYAPVSDATITIGFEKQEIGDAVGSTWTAVETEAVVIAADQDSNVVHYTFDSSTFSVGEIVAITIQSDVDPGGNLLWIISSVMEYDWSTQYSGSSAIHT